MPQETREAVHLDKFSYLVLKKGAKHQSSSCKYPRLVEQPIVKAKNGYAICRLCTNRGMLEEVLVKKKSRCVRVPAFLNPYLNPDCFSV